MAIGPVPRVARIERSQDHVARDTAVNFFKQCATETFARQNFTQSNAAVGSRRVESREEELTVQSSGKGIKNNPSVSGSKANNFIDEPSSTAFRSHQVKMKQSQV